MGNKQTIWSKAPLRLGLAGGGTDVSPYSEDRGGCVLNSTINLYAYSVIEPRDDNKIIFESYDLGYREEYSNTETIDSSGPLCLLKGVYNHVIEKYDPSPLSFKLSTFVDAPPGSGLGTSSTLVVSILGNFAEWLGLALGEYEIAHESYIIERIKLEMSGGKQDQYAATFGGFNFMEFSEEDKVIVNPLRIKQNLVNTLEISLILCHLGTSRYSSEIIEDMTKNMNRANSASIKALDIVKEQAIAMKEAILTENLTKFSQIMNEGWLNKKKVAKKISNPRIDKFYEIALSSGAMAGRVSGAGGGGFMLFFCNPINRYSVIQALEKEGGQVRSYKFVKQGLEVWKV